MPGIKIVQFLKNVKSDLMLIYSVLKPFHDIFTHEVVLYVVAGRVLSSIFYFIFCTRAASHQILSN